MKKLLKIIKDNIRGYNTRRKFRKVNEQVRDWKMHE